MKNLGIFLGIALFSLTRTVQAQDTAPVLTPTAEYNLGFDCPVASALAPSQTTLWVLMNDCFEEDYTLREFNPVDGLVVSNQVNDYVDSLSALQHDTSVSWLVSALSFTTPDTVNIIYSDGNNDYELANISFSLTSGEAVDPSTMILNSDTINTFIPDYDGYLGSTVYNLNHTLAAVSDRAGFHILDLVAGVERLQIPVENEPYTYNPSFSADSQRLYLPGFDNLNDTNDFSATLNIYSLETGEVLNIYAVPSALLWVSPDEHYAVALIGTSAGTSQTLQVIDLETSTLSNPISVYEKPHQVTKCLNDGNNASDRGNVVSGRLPIMGLNWLPDSSGFVTVNSYWGGVVVNGDGVCIFDYSRMRLYSVS